jgi:hypothetical protein
MFRGFRDIYYQCSYEPVLPVRLKDIEIADYGLRYVSLSFIELFLNM